MTKADYRKQYLLKRKELEQPEVDEASEDIVSRLRSEFRFEGKTVHLFMPIRKNREIDLEALMEFILRSGGKVVVPVTNFNDHSMENVLVNPDTDFAENDYGIPEPTEGDRLASEAIDMVILPLLAFDRDGHRIGYGKGFYDRFLEGLRKDCLKIGVSLFDPESRFREVDDHDIPMDMCVTPERIWRFSTL